MQKQKQKHKKQKKTGKRYTQEFQQYAVERMKTCSSITALAKELGLPRVRLYLWRAQLDPSGGPWRAIARPMDDEKLTLQQQLHKTQQLLAEKTLEVDFFKGALQKIEARRQRSGNTGETTSTSKSGK